MKKALAIALAALLTIQPVQAKQDLPPMTPKQEQQFCKAIFGVDDAIVSILVAGVVASIVAHIGLTYLENWARGKQIEEMKAEAAERCNGKT